MQSPVVLRSTYDDLPIFDSYPAASVVAGAARDLGSAEARARIA